MAELREGRSTDRRVGGGMIGVLILVGVAAAQGPGIRTVRVTGRAEGTNLTAKDEALQDAKRKAVEQLCGTFIDAGSEVADYALVRDTILSHAAGYISQYRVKNEWEEEGIWHCEITAFVKIQDLEHDWKAQFRQLKEAMDNPRMMIIITQDNDATDDESPALGGAAQRRLERYFLAQDVDLIDQDVSEQVRARDIELADVQQNIDKLAALAAAFKTDVLVIGEAKAVPGGDSAIRGRRLYRWNVSMNFTVVQADSARKLASNSYTPDKPFLTTGRHCTDNAFTELIDARADRMLKDIYDAWKKRATSHRIIELQFTGCSFSQWKDKIRPALLELRGIQQGTDGVKLRNLENNVAFIDVYWAFDHMILAEKVSELKAGGLHFEVTGVNKNRISLEVKE